MMTHASKDSGTDTASACGCTIRGVSCDVQNCVYHDGAHFCTAGQISVGPHHASSCTDTVCTTFREKQP